MPPGVIAILSLAVILTAGLVALARILSENQTRRHLADRGLTAGEIAMLFERSRALEPGATRAALVVLAVGCALILAQYLPYDSSDPFVYGLILAAAGLASLSHVLIVSARARRNRRDVAPPK